MIGEEVRALVSTVRASYDGMALIDHVPERWSAHAQRTRQTHCPRGLSHSPGPTAYEVSGASKTLVRRREHVVNGWLSKSFCLRHSGDHPMTARHGRLPPCATAPSPGQARELLRKFTHQARFELTCVWLPRRSEFRTLNWFETACIWAHRRSEFGTRNAGAAVAPGSASRPSAS